MPHASNHRIVRPVKASIGLSSRVNREFVLQILNNSTQEEIEKILREARYRPRNPLSPNEMGDTVKKEVSKYLQTAEGTRQFNREIERAVNGAGAAWLDSSRGQEELSRIKAELLKTNVAKDDDYFLRVCKQELDARVERWIRSSVGQETLEFQKMRAIERELKNSPKAKTASWIDRELQSTKKHA